MMKIAIVANRSPVTPVERDGIIHLEKSIGGLTAALEPLVRREEGEWFCTSEGDIDFDSLPYQIHSLNLEKEEIKSFYEGYCNQQLWPICHGMPSHARFKETDWRNYCRVNAKMANLILDKVDEDTMIWIHDYHFMLLPALLKAENPRLKIGFFLHIPFPHVEMFRILGVHHELIRGMQGADLIGFQCEGCIRNFHEAAEGSVIGNIQAFPISIDFNRFDQVARSEIVLEKYLQLRNEYKSDWVGLSVDRLDYSKGHLERLAGIDTFFDLFPDYKKKVTFVQISVPSRTNIPEYRELKHQVDEKVGQINGKHAVNGWTPVHYIYGNLAFEELVAYYLLGDIALVTPLRDGMNLVAKEYVATRVHHDGALILSEFAGAANELESALIVNPYHKERLADVIHHAIEMSGDEKSRRMENLRETVRKHDLYYWEETYLKAFQMMSRSI